MQRILHCLIGNMNQGGIENNLMEIYRNIDKSKYQFDFVVHESNSFYKNEIEKLGGRIYIIPFKSKHFIEFYKKFSLLMKNQEYSIVHFHTSYSIIYFDVKIAKRFKKIVLCHAHASNIRGFLRKIFHLAFKKKLSRIADYHIAVSNQSAKWQFPKYIYINKKYIILKNSINTEKFKFNPIVRLKIREQLSIKNKFVLGNVGRLVKSKNIIFLINMMPILTIYIKDVVLYIIGDGPERENLENLVNFMRIKNILFIGNVDNVSEVLNALDVFCFPSLTEGFGISVLEAEASGLPCIINEKLPEELDFTSNIYRLPLDMHLWIRTIIDISRLNIMRDDLSKLVLNAGYDVKQNCRSWENLYNTIL